MSNSCRQWRRHGGGGAGGQLPPYDFEGKKGEEGKRRKGRGKKEKGGEKKKKEKGKKERKKRKEKKKKKNLVMAFCVQDNAVFIHKFSKILPAKGGKPPSHTFPRSVLHNIIKCQND